MESYIDIDNIPYDFPFAPTLNDGLLDFTFGLFNDASAFQLDDEIIVPSLSQQQEVIHEQQPDPAPQVVQTQQITPESVYKNALKTYEAFTLMENKSIEFNTTLRNEIFSIHGSAVELLLQKSGDYSYSTLSKLLKSIGMMLTVNRRFEFCQHIANYRLIKQNNPCCYSSATPFDVVIDSPNQFDAFSDKRSTSPTYIKNISFFLFCSDEEVVDPSTDVVISTYFPPGKIGFSDPSGNSTKKRKADELDIDTNTLTVTNKRYEKTCGGHAWKITFDLKIAAGTSTRSDICQVNLIACITSKNGQQYRIQCKETIKLFISSNYGSQHIHFISKYMNSIIFTYVTTLGKSLSLGQQGVGILSLKLLWYVTSYCHEQRSSTIRGLRDSEVSDILDSIVIKEAVKIEDVFQVVQATLSDRLLELIDVTKPKASVQTEVNITDLWNNGVIHALSYKHAHALIQSLATSDNSSVKSGVAIITTSKLYPIKGERDHPLDAIVYTPEFGVHQLIVRNCVQTNFIKTLKTAAISYLVAIDSNQKLNLVDIYAVEQEKYSDDYNGYRLVF